MELSTDLMVENHIPKVLHKFTHGVYIGVIFLVANSTGAVGQGLQFIIDTFESART